MFLLIDFDLLTPIFLSLSLLFIFYIIFCLPCLGGEGDIYCLVVYDCGIYSIGPVCPICPICPICTVYPPPPCPTCPVGPVCPVCPVCAVCIDEDLKFLHLFFAAKSPK